MYAKVYEQIFDSSIAENWQTRHVFIDLIMLANAHGEVDMTHEAIARRTNVPLEIVKAAITELEQPDPKSRNPAEEGRRIIRLDDHRDWGWRIVNHGYYRSLRSDDDRRTAARLRQQEHRKSLKMNKKQEKCVTSVTESDDALLSASVSVSSSVNRKKGSPEGKKPHNRDGEIDAILSSGWFRDDDFKCAWADWIDYRNEIKHPLTPVSMLQQLKTFQCWDDKIKAIQSIRQSIINGWRGLFEVRQGSLPIQPVKRAPEGQGGANTGHAGLRQAWQIQKDLEAIKGMMAKINSTCPFGTSAEAEEARKRWRASANGLEYQKLKNRCQALEQELRGAL